MPTAANVIQLRQLLVEKLPGVRLGIAKQNDKGRWATGLPQFDKLLHGGLAKGGITELVAPPNGSGGAMFIQALLQQACATRQWMALVDGADSFDPAGVGRNALCRLLWVRCNVAEQAIKCADLILRDHNLPLVVVDLSFNHSIQLRKIPSSTWHRFRRLIEEHFTTLLVVTPSPTASNVDARLFLEARFDLNAIEKPRVDLLPQLSAIAVETAAEADLRKTA